MFRRSTLPIAVDLEGIETTRAHTVHSHWGTRFYGENLPPGFSTDPDEVEDYLRGGDVEGDGPIPEHLLRDMHDASALEAYGPFIEPSTFADLVEWEDLPTDQNCTVCTESHPRDDCMLYPTLRQPWSKHMTLRRVVGIRIHRATLSTQWSQSSKEMTEQSMTSTTAKSRTRKATGTGD
jgi:hypothetical protein